MPMFKVYEVIIATRVQVYPHVRTPRFVVEEPVSVHLIKSASRFDCGSVWRKQLNDLTLSDIGFSVATDTHLNSYGLTDCQRAAVTVRKLDRSHGVILLSPDPEARVVFIKASSPVKVAHSLDSSNASTLKYCQHAPGLGLVQHFCRRHDV